MASTHKLASPNAHVMCFLVVSAPSLLGILSIGFPILCQLPLWASMILLSVGTTVFFSASCSLDLSLLFFLFSFPRCQDSSRLGFFSLFLATWIVCLPKTPITVRGGERDLGGHQDRLCYKVGHPLAHMCTPQSGMDEHCQGTALGCHLPMSYARMSQNTFHRTLNQKEGQQISQDSTYKCWRDISCWTSSP